MKSHSYCLGIGLILAAANASAQPATTPTVPPAVPPAPLPPQNIQLPPGQTMLTLDKAVELAIQQQPTLREAQAQADAAYGRVDLAKVARNPTVTLSASAGLSSNIGRTTLDPTTGMATTTNGGFFTVAEQTGLAAQINWRIYDFGQTSINIRAAELNADAARVGIDTTRLDVRLNVATAYLTTVADQKLVKVAETTVKSEEGHLDQAKRFVLAQAKDPIEVVEAQARLANAKSALAQAQSNLAVALANLRAAIGWIDPANSFVVEANWPEPPAQDPAQLGQLVGEAREHRPEITAFDKQVAAGQASLDAAHAERRPILAGTAQTSWTPDSQDWNPDPTWSAGLTLSWNLFDGFKSRADVKIAKANLANVQAQRDALLVSLTSALDSARAQIVADRANVQASNEAVTSARAQLQLAEARYTQGLGSQIELTDAETAVTTAEGNLVSAEFQLGTAWEQLRRALGQI
jgi:outer membrane protein